MVGKITYHMHLYRCTDDSLNKLPSAMLTYDERVFQLNDNLDLQTEIVRDPISGKRELSYGEYTIVPGDHVTNIYDAGLNRKLRVWGSIEDVTPRIESFLS